MAYQQQYDDYQQPRQQQYYNHAGPPQGRQPAGYANPQYAQQYDDYGYEYEQWDDGYYNQQPAYGDMNGRHPSQRRAPPPQAQYAQDQYAQDQYAQDQVYDQQYQQPPRRDPRGGPMGRGNPPPPLQGREGLRPPGKSSHGFWALVADGPANRTIQAENAR